MEISIKVEGLKQLQQKFKAAQNKLNGSKQFWSSVGAYVQRQTIKERFDKEQSPDGEKWKPLAPATIKHRLKRHKTGKMKILQDTGELRRSIKYEAGDNSVKVGSKLKYARTHQFGRDKIPRRPFLGVTDEEKRHIVQMYRQYVIRNVFGGA